MLKKILIIVLLLGSTVFAQSENTSVKIKVSARVVEFLEMVTLADIDVGTVIPAEDILTLNPLTDQGAGMILVQGRANASVQIHYSSQVEMVNLQTSTALVVDYAVSGNMDNQQTSSTIFTSNPGTITLSDKGEYYLFIGCSFSLLNLTSGQYDGDFVIEVEYN